MRTIWGRQMQLILLLMAMISGGLFAQSKADSLHVQARAAAFDQKNYPLAVQLCEQALELQPDRAETRVFLGRVLAWQARYPLAQQTLQAVLDSSSTDLDARLALLDVLLWSSQYAMMESRAQEGLALFPNSLDLKYRLGLAQLNQGQAQKARVNFQAVANADPDFPKIQEQLSVLQNDLKDRKLRLTLGYERLADTQTAWQFLVVDASLDPWRMAALEYEHPTRYGPLILRLTEANRFASSGSQVELEAYPKLGQTRYGYIGFGVSAASIFPEWKGGLELFQDMGHGFEASLGLRYLKVPLEGITVYTVSVGKYLGNFWLNARSFITPQSDVFSRSFNFLIRGYLADADQYWELSAGTGEVPDENLGAAEINYLSARRVEGLWQFKLRASTVAQVRLSLSNQEVRTDAFRGSSGLSLTLEQRF